MAGVGVKVDDSDSSTDIEPVEETNCYTVMPSTSTKKNARSRPKNPKAKSKRATKIKRNRSEEQLISDSDSDSNCLMFTSLFVKICE